jgi:hypothetical protein
MSGRRHEAKPAPYLPQTCPLLAPNLPLPDVAAVLQELAQIEQAAKAATDQIRAVVRPSRGPHERL